MKTNGLKPKEATKITTVIIRRFECPWCQYHIENPDGGEIDWTQEALANYIKDNGNVIECGFCGNPVRLPRR